MAASGVLVEAQRSRAGLQPLGRPHVAASGGRRQVENLPGAHQSRRPRRVACARGEDSDGREVLVFEFDDPLDAIDFSMRTAASEHQRRLL